MIFPQGINRQISFLHKRLMLMSIGQKQKLNDLFYCH